MIKKSFGVVAVLLFFITFAAAELSISGVNPVYNLGDELQFSIGGVQGETYGNLNVDLVCFNTTNLLRIPANSFSETEEVTYSVSKVVELNDLDITNFSSILGECRIDVKLNSESVSTDNFKISDEIDVELSLDKDNYDPTDLINLRVDAVKENGDLVNGLVDIEGEYTTSKGVVNGLSIESFNVAPTTEAGTYLLNVTVYDTGSSGVLNNGYEEVRFTINQVADHIITSISSPEVMPGESFSLGAEVFDQSGKSMEGYVVVRIISPDSKETDLGIESGDFVEIPFETNSSAGYYSIISRFGDVTDEREILVKEVQKVDFFINDTVLVVTNVGNVVYNKTIDVTIGNDTEQLDLNMAVGEVRKFSLKAPKGDYSVSATDGDSYIEGFVFLTGRAISVSDAEDALGIELSMNIMWIFLIIVLLLVTLFLVMRSKKTTVLADRNHNSGFRERLRQTRERFSKFSHNFPSKIKRVAHIRDDVERRMPKNMQSDVHNSLHRTHKNPGVVGYDNEDDGKRHEDSSMVDLTKTSRGGVAESAVVMKGEKHTSAVICVHVKNHKELGVVAKNHLIKIINKARDQKGLVDWKDDFVFIVYSPLVTKTYSNELLAVKAAFGILKDLQIHNRKFTHKIEYNLGVHVGDLVSSKERGKLKYTSLGNTISFAKRIAMNGSGKMLVSDDVRRKITRDLKTTKNGEVAGHSVYEVSEIKDREANEAKLKDLLGRMKE